MKTNLYALVAIAGMAALTAVAQTPVLLQTFNNPAPEAADYFGIGLAALGSDRVLVGAPYDDTTATNAGIVYLFHTNGTLLTTITNPNPAFASYPEGQFGSTIATLGSDLVAIGSSLSAKTYLFSTNGALVTTLTSPSIYDTSFGKAVAAFGNDRVLISSTSAYPDPDPESGDIQGAAFLYGTNGTFQMIFFNPYPGSVGLFGWSVCAFGSDRVLIGAGGPWTGAGGVFLFHTNGALLTTFTNPAPHVDDFFGRSIAAVGADRVLVGSPATGSAAEAVHLFNTNGTFLLTITNPTPAAGDSFGHSIAVLGNDRMIISAPNDDTTGTNSGAAYVFSLDGTLLATINNPTPGVWFGLRLVPFGNDSVLISAISYNGDGVAYLFSVPSLPSPPSLNIRRTATNTVVISWSSTATGFVLQQNTNGVSSVNWSNVTAGIQDDSTNKTLIVNPTDGARFYRLVSP